jgi:hypothetical protein
MSWTWQDRDYYRDLRPPALPQRLSGEISHKFSANTHSRQRNLADRVKNLTSSAQMLIVENSNG